MLDFFRIFIVACIMSLLSAVLRAAPTTVEIIDAYTNIHSGPDQNYPVFHAIERGETIELLNRRPGWYRIKTSNGKIGWISETKLSRTLQTSGTPVALPRITYGDVTASKYWAGFSTGQFASSVLKSYELLFFSGGYRIRPWLSLGTEYGRTYEADVSGNLYGAHLLFEPFNRYPIIPSIELGFGRISLDSLPDQGNFSSGSVSHHFLGLGGSYYIGRRFTISADIRHYRFSLNPNDTSSNTWRVGFKTFF